MKFLFVSPHNYLDQGGGASISGRELFFELTQQGHEVRTLCGVLFDGKRFDEGRDVLRQRISLLKINAQSKIVSISKNNRKYSVELLMFLDNSVFSYVVLPTAENEDLSSDEYQEAYDLCFLHSLNRLITSDTPDALLAYGGQDVVSAAAEKARRLGVRSWFMLHNLSYQHSIGLNFFDEIVVPSDFARRHYLKKVGLESSVLTPLMHPDRIQIDRNSRRFLTFVNPSVEKGGYWTIGIARELNRIRPDISILIVDSRNNDEIIRNIPEVRELKNLYFSRQVPRPSDYLKDTRLLLVPSLCEESFGRVAVEAGLCGIPVIVSNRGAVAEIVGGVCCDLVLPMPERMNPFLKVMPTEDEISPWIQKIIEIWDDENKARQLGAELQAGFKRYSYPEVKQDIARLFAKSKKSA